MFCPGVSTLADGRIMVTGGQSSNATSIFNPWNDTWIPGASMVTGRGYQSQTTLSDGTVFVLGGSWSGGIGGKSGEIYAEQGVAQWNWKSGIAANGSLLTNDTQGTLKKESAHGPGNLASRQTVPFSQRNLRVLPI